MIKLFQRETCPYCKPIRARLTELGVSYINVSVEPERAARRTLIAETGAFYIPALVDGDTVIPGKPENYDAVLRYIEEKFSAGSATSDSRARHEPAS